MDVMVCSKRGCVLFVVVMDNDNYNYNYTCYSQLSSQRPVSAQNGRISGTTIGMQLLGTKLCRSGP